MPGDVDDMVQQDARKARSAIQNYRNQDGIVGGVWQAVEGVLWTFSALSVLFMIVSMPWVGQDKLIAGQTWIGLSVGGITLFAVCGGIARYLRLYADAGGLNAGTVMGRERGGGRR